MRLVVVAPYRAREVAYEVGQVLEVEPRQAQALLADSPGSFRVQEDTPRLEPPVTGQVMGAAVTASLPAAAVDLPAAAGPVVASSPAQIVPAAIGSASAPTPGRLASPTYGARRRK